MEGGFAVGEIGEVWIDNIFLELRFLDWNNFGFDMLSCGAHKRRVGVDIDNFLGVFWEFCEFVGDSFV